MEEKIPKISLSDAEFITLLTRIKNYDQEATLEVIEAFDGEIKRLAKYMRLNQEEAVQTLITELIAILQSE